MEVDDYLDSTPEVDPEMNQKYEEPIRKRDEDLPPPTLKTLPKEIKYRFLDETNKFPVIVSANLIKKEEET